MNTEESKSDSYKQISTLQARLSLNKKFLYMVIHDLKHPSDNINYNLVQTIPSFKDRIKAVKKVKINLGEGRAQLEFLSSQFD